MTPPVFLAVAALGLAAPLMAQTPVHSMPREDGAFPCLPIESDAESGGETIRAGRQVMVFCESNPLGGTGHFRPVSVTPIDGWEAPEPARADPAGTVPGDSPPPVARGVMTVGRITASVPPAGAPVPEPSASLLIALAAAGLILRRRGSGW